MGHRYETTRRRIAAAVWVATCALALTGCELYGDDGADNVCESAQHRFQSCGVTVPLIDDGPCTGIFRSTSMCVVDYAQDCEDVASLARRLDLCFVALVDLPAGAIPDNGGSGTLFPPGPTGAGEPETGFEQIDATADEPTCDADASDGTAACPEEEDAL